MTVMTTVAIARRVYAGAFVKGCDYCRIYGTGEVEDVVARARSDGTGRRALPRAARLHRCSVETLGPSPPRVKQRRARVLTRQLHS